MPARCRRGGRPGRSAPAAAAGALVTARQEEQLPGEPGQPGGLLAGRVTASASSAGLRPGRPASSSSPLSTASGVRSSWLASATSSRCANQGALQPAEQLIHGHGQRGDLIARPRHAHARRSVALGQRRDLAAQPLDRREGRPGQPVSTQPGRQHQHAPCCTSSSPITWLTVASRVSRETPAIATQPGCRAGSSEHALPLAVSRDRRQHASRARAGRGPGPRAWGSPRRPRWLRGLGRPGRRPGRRTPPERGFLVTVPRSRTRGGSGMPDPAGLRAGSRPSLGVTGPARSRTASCRG